LYLTGDFNCRKGSSPYSSIVDNGDFVDARTVAAADNSVVNGTFHAYGTADMEIDFCFYRGDETVLEYEIISQKYISEGETEAGFVSDHYGVIVTFKKEG
jgi:endonuclease/exonuclease/phosphatase family metal-dependent hydrolase